MQRASAESVSETFTSVGIWGEKLLIQHVHITLLESRVFVLDFAIKRLQVRVPVNQAVEQRIHELHIPWPQLQQSGTTLDQSGKLFTMQFKGAVPPQHECVDG